MNIEAIKAIYINEMRRAVNSLMQSLASPVISTILYFVVFGSAIGSRIETVGGVNHGAFIEIIIGYVGAALPNPW